MTTKIEFGNILAAVNRQAVQFFWRGRGGRFTPRHLSVFFQPVERSQGLVYTLHVTDPRKPPSKRRIFLPEIPADRLVAVMNGIGDDIARVWVSKSRHVELQVLQDGDWLILLPGKDTAEYIIDALKVRDGRYRFKRSPVIDLFFKMLDDSVEPLDLDGLPPPEQPLVAIRLNEDDMLEMIYVSYYPHGLEGPPGWYVTPMDWLGHDDEVFKEVIFRHLPVEFWDGFRKAARLLGLLFDQERVAADLAKYRLVP